MTVKVVGLVKAMVTGKSKFGSVELSTVPELMVAAPLFEPAAVVLTAPAAAICAGLLSTTLRLSAAVAVG